MTGTVELSETQAQNIIDNVLTNKSVYAMKVPKTNGCINLQHGISLRKLPVKFRGGDIRSKAFRLKGPVDAMRSILKYVNPDNNKSVSMTLKGDK